MDSLKNNPILIGVECVGCGKRFTLPDVKAVEEIELATADCAHCGRTHIFADGCGYDLHEYLNSRDSRWPKNGEGTFTMELP